MNSRIAIPIALFIAPESGFSGGIERTPQSTDVIFESGNYVELSFGIVSPEISGSVQNGTRTSGDLAQSHRQPGFAIKHQVSDHISAALVYDQPYGADVSYPQGVDYPFAGATAVFDTYAWTGILKYKFDNNVSILAGIRYQTVSAEAGIPAIANYIVDGGQDSGLGYLVGVAYEKPEIALRITLTYHSSIDHTLSARESSALTSGTVLNSDTDFATPQSVNLKFQTGIAPNTLLFGGVRWVEWSEFDLSPEHYSQLTRGLSLVSFRDDVFTYSLGLGHRFNETWSGSISMNYEKSNGGTVSNLGPKDGLIGLSVGAKYTRGPMEISGGVNYTMIGDANTRTTAGLSDFTDNDALSFGVKVAYRY